MKGVVYSFGERFCDRILYWHHVHSFITFFRYLKSLPLPSPLPTRPKMSTTSPWPRSFPNRTTRRGGPRSCPTLKNESRKRKKSLRQPNKTSRTSPSNCGASSRNSLITSTVSRPQQATPRPRRRKSKK